VTGGSRGIGAEITVVLAEVGTDVAITGRDAKGLEATREAVAKHGRRCIVIEADLATADGPHTAARQALDFFGTVDALVNNAGTFYREPILGTTVEHWDETLAVNAPRPTIARSGDCSRHDPAKKRQDHQRVLARQPRRLRWPRFVQSASKGGLNLLTQVLAAEWGPSGIQTNAIAPAIVLTDMARAAWGDEAKSAPVKAHIPLRRFGEPIEIADLVLDQASSASDYLCGQVIDIDSGYSAVEVKNGMK